MVGSDPILIVAIQCDDKNIPPARIIAPIKIAGKALEEKQTLNILGFNSIFTDILEKVTSKVCTGFIERSFWKPVHYCEADLTIHGCGLYLEMTFIYILRA